MKGWVYVISNPSMPGVVKVGYSMKDPSIRANDLDSTGMPTAYRVEYEALVEEPYQVEQQIHHEMQAFHAGKEWFKTDTLNAVLAIRRCAGSVFFENYRELAEYEIRIKEAEAACKAEQDSFRSWRESIREIYTSELAYEQSAARSKIEKKFAELAFECFLIPRSTAIIFGFVAGIAVLVMCFLAANFVVGDLLLLAGLGVIALCVYLNVLYAGKRNEILKRSEGYVNLMKKKELAIDERLSELKDEAAARYKKTVADEEKQHFMRLEKISEPLVISPPRMGYHQWNP